MLFEIHLFTLPSEDVSVATFENACAAVVVRTGHKCKALNLSLKVPDGAIIITHQSSTYFTGTDTQAVEAAADIRSVLEQHGCKVVRTKIELASASTCGDLVTDGTSVASEDNYFESHIRLAGQPETLDISHKVSAATGIRVVGSWNNNPPHQRFVNFRSRGSTYESHKAKADAIVQWLHRNAYGVEKVITEFIAGRLDDNAAMDKGWIE